MKTYLHCLALMMFIGAIPVSQACVVDPNLINAPSNLTRTTFNPTTRQITLAWQDNSNNETVFQLWSSLDGGLTWDWVLDAATNATSATFTAAPVGQMQFFKVYAFNLEHLVISLDSNIISVEGTNPTVADTDGDGMVDAFEVTNSLDPYTPDGYGDLDGDRYPNIFEYSKGTDVLNANSTPTPNFIVNPAGGGFSTLQSALNAVNVDYQIIRIADGIYKGAGNVGLTFPSARPILFMSQNGASRVTIDGELQSRVLTVGTSSVIDGITITRGSATQGAGVYVQGGAPFIINSVFLNNQASQSGGALYQQNGGSVIVHSTFSKNTAPTAGAVFAALGHVDVMKSIFWNPSSVSETGVTGGATVSITDTIVRGGYAGTGNLSSDPLLTVNGHLMPTSPALNKGDLLETSLWDMDGEQRPAGATSDLGADEFVDADGDQLPDSWEMSKFGNLNSLANGDPDADKVTNLLEYLNGTNPGVSLDTDTDTLADDWEIYRFGSLQQNAQGDPDQDGLSNSDEFALDSNPQTNDITGGNQARNYQYDAANRLRQVTGGPLAETINFDAESNITNQ